MCRMDPQRLGSNFEIFGLDFMVDAEFKPWLIEVNTNPCLELSSPVLAKLIPVMLDNALRIGLDPLFWPSEATMLAKKNSFSEPFERNRFVLILD
jgi:tubulin polyglutamylase TTLL1